MVMGAAIAINDRILRIIAHDRRSHDVLAVLPFDIGAQDFTIKQSGNLIEILQRAVAACIPVVSHAVIDRRNRNTERIDLVRAWEDTVFSQRQRFKIYGPIK